MLSCKITLPAARSLCQLCEPAGQFGNDKPETIVAKDEKFALLNTFRNRRSVTAGCVEDTIRASNNVIFNEKQLIDVEERIPPNEFRWKILEGENKIMGRVVGYSSDRQGCGG